MRDRNTARTCVGAFRRDDENDIMAGMDRRSERREPQAARSHEHHTQGNDPLDVARKITNQGYNKKLADPLMRCFVSVIEFGFGPIIWPEIRKSL